MNIPKMLEKIESQTAMDLFHAVITFNGGVQIITGFFDTADEYLYCISPLQYIHQGQNYTLIPYNQHSGTLIEVFNRSSIQSFAICNADDLEIYKEQVNKQAKFEFYQIDKKEEVVPKDVVIH